MAEVQLQPDELDRLEDALEELEFADLLEDPSPAVRARLADYRALLIASRDALPMVEVPPGVLAGVLAEARRSPDEELLELSAADEPKRESWWTRMRKSFLIPSIAVVGTAALILIIVTPTMSDAPNAEDLGVVAKADQSTVENGRMGKPAAQEPAAIPATPAEEPAPEAADGPADDALGDEAEEEAPLYEIATARRSSAGKLPGATTEAEKKTADAPAVAQGEDDLTNEESAAPGGKDEKQQEGQAASSWEAIERGDKARLGGDCFRASNEYHRALDDGNDSVRARALAGLGLCANEDGNTARADSYFEEARALDPEVAGYIDTQSNDHSRKAKKPAPRKKENTKRKASMPSQSLESGSLPGDARNANPFKD